MKRPFFFKISMARSLMLLMLALTSIAAFGQEAYSVFTEADSTLTFFYDDQRSTRSGTTYSLEITDSVPDWYENREKVSQVVFDTTFVAARPTSTRAWFCGLNRLDSITGIKYLNTDSVTDMGLMFSGCESLTALDLSGFNTANVTDMRLMFGGCKSLYSLNLSNFNTSNVTVMGGMFNGCQVLTTLDLSNFNTSNVTNMAGMFYHCRSLTSLDLSGFKTSNVTVMGSMFEGCISLTSLDLSKFNTSNVTDMRCMFANCLSLDSLDVSKFNTSNVTDMGAMFGNCQSLTALDVSAFNTSNVIVMGSMFDGCTSLTSLDLRAFNTSKATSMNHMFHSCNRLETIYISKDWSTDSVTISYSMFLDCFSLVGEQGTTYDVNHVDVAYAHLDGGPANPGYLSYKREPYASLSTGQTKTMTFYYDPERSTRSGSTYLLNTGVANPDWFADAASVTRVQFDSTFVFVRPTTTFGWFSGMNKLDTIIGIQYLNTDSVTDMRRMFQGCESLTAVDLSGFNTANVTNMWAMFVDCKSLASVDLGGFNTSQVTNMARMFSGCESLTSLDLSGFKTDNVKDMAGMFAGCSKLKDLDVSGFNTTSVKYMSWMFDSCKLLTSIDLNGFSTPRVTEMECMFQGCESLTVLDLSRFKTRNVHNMEAMFSGCSHLETIYAGYGWSTNAVSESGEMFAGCTSLVGGQGTTYDEHHVDAARARVDGGPEHPGYFTGSTTETLPPGDVNGDGEVSIADVNCIINVILGSPDIYEGRADVNDDGEITIADVNAVLAVII